MNSVPAPSPSLCTSIVAACSSTHYADEIRSPEAIDHGAKTSVEASELKLAERLIADLSKDKFEDGIEPVHSVLPS
jgi:non-homologous end joining protein Ku